MLYKAILVLFCFPLFGCNPPNNEMQFNQNQTVVGSGISATAERTTSAYDSLQVSGAFRLNITLQNARKLSLAGDDNILPIVVTEVNNRVLHIYYKAPVAPKSPISVSISTSDLSGISSSGNNNIRLANMHNEGFVLNMSGNGSFQANGKTERLSVTLNGATKARMRNLQASTVSAVLSGACKAEVYASNSLSANVNGTGSITYFGHPQTVNRNVAGIGIIRPGN